MKWIRFEDKLPKYNEVVIFYLYRRGVDSGYKLVISGKRIRTDKDGEIYEFFSVRKDHHTYKMISWQPLPKPPKERL